mmetsp:Transcript_622/g.1754  ORF Transcript_622/g.1754 Transcript_622/m.1754 type:complete len:206 (-) Transcript_622:180-797(-)
MITFDGFCTSPVSGRAITLRWLAGLSARTFVAASSLIRLSSRNLSTSSIRSGVGLRLLRLRRRLWGAFSAALPSDALPPSSLPEPLPFAEISASLTLRLSPFFFFEPFSPSPGGIAPGGIIPIGGIIPGCMPGMDGMPCIPIIGGMPGIVIMPCIPIMPGMDCMPGIPIMPMGFIAPPPAFIGHSFVLWGPAHVAHIHLEAEEAS